MTAVHTKLGVFKGLSKADFGTRANVTTSGRFIESKGTVHFEHGDATSELMFRDGLLVQFSIKSDKLGDDWFKGPTDSSVYRQRGERFVRQFFEKDVPGLTASMHENLKKEVPADKLKAMMDTVSEKAGPLKSLSYQEEKFTTDGGQTLTVHYHVTCEKASLVANIEFRFIGLKGHIWGFDFKSGKD